MTNKIVSASLALVLGWGGTAFAQTEADALRYTRLGLNGSARIQGMGGANAALGADISSLSVNPAGLGLFRRSEFSISPGFHTANVETKLINREGGYIGTPTTDTRTSLNIPQAGIIISDRKGDDDASDWRGVTFGASFTRLNNFNTRTTYQGRTSGRSDDWTITEYFAELANNNAEVSNGQTFVFDQLHNEFTNRSGGYNTLQGMAYGTYLIGVFDDANGEYASAYNKIGVVNFEEVVQRRGSQNQFDIGAGTNYRDKLYLGAAIGITSVNFTQERIYREQFTHRYIDEDDNNKESDVNVGLALEDRITSRGGGINLRLGTIYRFSDAFRAGISIQSPTLYTFDEAYDTYLTTTHSLPSLGSKSAEQKPGQFSYTLVTPFRATGGLAYFFSKHGFLTADVEYVNYGNATFSETESEFGSSGSFFTNLNQGVEGSYQSAINLRLGAEARYQVFRFRAGLARTGDPYKSSSLDGSVNTFTLGAGMRFQNFYIDAAYARSNSDNRYIPYSFNEGASPEVGITDRMSNVMFTAGFNF